MGRFIVRGLAASVMAAMVGVGGIAIPKVGSATQAVSSPHTASASPLATATMAHVLAKVGGTGPRPTMAPLPTTGLQAAWNRLASYPSLQHSTVSAYAYDVTTNQPLAAVNPEVEVTPGSVTKLFTSAAALAAVGPNFKYVTTVKTPSTVIKGQPEPIYLVGGGDPWLEANGRHDLETLAKTVASHIKKATRVVGVNALFSPPLYGIGWPIGGVPQDYSAGTSALMAERGEVTVWVHGASAPGQRPTITLKFNGKAQDPAFFPITNRAVTSSSTATTIAVTRILGTNRIVITGRIPQNSFSGPSVVSVDNPALFAAALFQSALAHDGVSFTQTASSSTAEPAGLTAVARLTSMPEVRELNVQNRFSINQIAENLYRELGVSQNKAGTLQASQAAMASFTAAAGVDPGRIQVDGSGLSPLDQMSAKQVVEMLTFSAAQKWFSVFEHSMIQLNNPKACGFLCPSSWRVSIPAHTAIFVKPGNLTNQWNLAGYTHAANGNLIAFAVLDDGTPTTENTFPNSAVGQMVNLTADWPKVPTVPALSAPLATTGTAPASVANILAAIPGKDSGTNVAVAVVNTANGEPVYQYDGQTLMRAGLSPRILLAMAALNNHSPVLSAAQVLQAGTLSQGTLSGFLVLDGRDNNLTPSDLQTLAQAVERAGVTEVSGGIKYVSSGSGFQQKLWPGGMAWEALGQGWASPDAQTWLNGDQVSLTISTPRGSSSAALSISPSDAPVRLADQVRVGAADSIPSVSISLRLNSNLFVVSGTIPSGSTVTETLAPPDPGLAAAVQFKDDLTAIGVHVAGPVAATVQAPAAAAALGQVPGQAVPDLVSQSLANASLTPSEQLLRLLGSSAGRKATAMLDGAPSSVNDWTGGSLGSYLTPLGLAQAMAHQYTNPAEQPLVHDLSNTVWQSTSPEQYEAVGYIPGPSHAVYAVVVLANALPWNGSFAPTITSP